MFGLSTSQWYGNGEVGVEEIPQAKCLARVFSKKHSSTIVGNVGIYSVAQKVCIRMDSLAEQNVS